MNSEAVKTPVHLWVVGVLAVLWSAVGSLDYSATQLRLDWYMSQFSEEQLAYVYGFPAWADGAWATAVWGGLLASFGLLLRRSWSMWLYAVSIIGLAVTTVYNLALSNGMEVMGEGAAGFTVVIWLISIGLFFYSCTMSRRGVLR